MKQAARKSFSPFFHSIFQRKAALLLCAALMWSFAQSAQNAEPAIVVGQSCDLSGPTSTRVKEYVKGVDAYIAHINAQGGVHGRPIRLVRYDDAFVADKGLENAKRLIEQDNAMLFFGMGSATVTAAILPYATAKGIPVFGSLSGADSLRKPNPWMFHFRASFGEEIEHITQYMATLGSTRIAVMAADAAIGHEGAAAMEVSAKTHKLELLKVAKISADLKNLDESAAALAQLQPQVILVLAPAGPAVKFVEALRKHQVHSQLVGVSVMSNDALHKALGNQAEGMMLTQTVPFPWNTKLAIVRDYQQLMTAAKITPSFDSMEGYVSARLLVDGLKAAGPQITRKSFVTALEAMNHKDVDGLNVSFSRSNRSLVRLVDISMISRNNRLIN